ncbi:hypothetical protein [Streptomyces rapamycinicus]|uniref:Toxin-antitoxin system, toxin component n=2 Tax=Streptomyces rapamycinicus TaxID=1226757 RepID=A0A0A0NQ63_STRRN|nr:hypothetical protein [Streptomyces rapamycinicus]AGP58323.1 hypothetical protein M271_34555 [Streptomyces rapamycinicus NRRL 5491]MBB4786015.1 hypothetical protein [Streptomyces rapamycinicus]RLV78522.1 hypothetical protein D3C57_109095 [Streptomyces rapamycinicus NRRL 5491]UTO66137.1 hypothetical protein LJB45_30005 [Streptomyces rapamycinicus]UTP34091.1 hypothetical protein LIV37_35140 [Streptomyces rapamycinicus NRRL 5491]
MLIVVWSTTNQQRHGDPMDLKTMRRSCKALVRDLDLPVPAEPDQVVAALCGRMRQRLGRAVHHRLVSFPPDTVSGLWVATDSAHYILCEKDTSPWHQLLITCHEFWHMEADHEATLAAGEASTRLVFPSLDPDTVARIVASRTHCSSEAEQEADFFASLLMAKVSRWLPNEIWTTPESPATAAVVRRLETSLGHAPDEGEK